MTDPGLADPCWRCKHCGGRLLEQRNLVGASRCVACGMGTTRPCGAILECGGHCGRPWRHDEVGALVDHVCAEPGHHHDEEPHPEACNAVLDRCGGLCLLPKNHGEGCVCRWGSECPAPKG
jgi:hypothetical protein